MPNPKHVDRVSGRFISHFIGADQKAANLARLELIKLSAYPQLAGSFVAASVNNCTTRATARLFTGIRNSCSRAIWSVMALLGATPETLRLPKAGAFFEEAAAIDSLSIQQNKVLESCLDAIIAKNSPVPLI
jgi:hypothetical protein